MDPIKLLGLVSNFAIFIPPPWGEIILALSKVAPLLEEGMAVLEAINKADPTLLPKIEMAAKQLFGDKLQSGDLETMGKIIFAPHKMTAKERLTAEQVAIDFQSGGGHG